jgi:hypothetical protein
MFIRSHGFTIVQQLQLTRFPLKSAHRRLKDVPLALSSQGHDADARPHEDHHSFIDRVKAAGVNALLGAFTARDG